MDPVVKKKILDKVKKWWKLKVIEAHKKKSKELSSSDKFSINPFLIIYLANFLGDKNDSKNIARSLIYPRALGTSPNTIFGTEFQKMIINVFDEISGSAVKGIDIEFTDKNDGRRKYCQIKAGPNVINYDDVSTIKDHFKKALAIAKTNSMAMRHEDLILCIIYGEPSQKSNFIRKVEEDYTVLIGKEFWERVVGDGDFYKDLFVALKEVSKKCNCKKIVNDTVNELSKDIEAKYPDLVS
ncbi:MAG: PmeII family type II restriction endonuclease [bacterium]|nr:PmeII family type II restriction endonuclease [bacterium]